MNNRSKTIMRKGKRYCGVMIQVTPTIRSACGFGIRNEVCCDPQAQHPHPGVADTSIAEPNWNI